MSLLTNDLAMRAIKLTEPFIEQLMAEGVAKRPHLHIVVARRHVSMKSYEVLAEQSIGNPAEWAHPYSEIAHGKTRISARTGLSSRKVQTMHPSLLEPSDVMFWGNAIMDDVIVSCSGVQPWIDEAISNAIAGLLRALVQQQLEDMRTSAAGETYAS